MHAAVMFSKINNLNSKAKTLFATNILIHGRIYNIDIKIIIFLKIKHLQFTFFAEPQFFNV